MIATVVPVFVSARQPGIPGPPLAAVRLTSEALPATVELSDANAMIEGRNLSSVDEVEVSARVAFGGTAITAPGDLVATGSVPPHLVPTAGLTFRTAGGSLW